MNQPAKPTFPTDLDHFMGGDAFHRHMSGMRFSAGVKYLADHAHAYWLIDVVGSHQTNPKVRAADWQLWTIEPDGNGGCVVRMREDSEESGAPILVEQRIEFTDFPFRLGEAATVKLYVEHGACILPSEH